ncbi:GntR family transcriptional regulator, partial [Acidisoma sp. C75]
MNTRSFSDLTAPLAAEALEAPPPAALAAVPPATDLAFEEPAAATLVTLSRVQRVVRVLSDAIVRGAIRPGQALDEVALAARFAISRTSMREALNHLCILGLAERLPRRGVIATLLSHAHLHSMFAVMAELEAAAARFAAAAMNAAERAYLAAVHEESRRLVREGATEAYEAANRRFHEVLYDGAHNDYLRDLALSTRNRLLPFRRAQFHLPGRLARSWAEHDQVVQAIMRGEAEGAAQAMRAHVTLVGAASAEYLPPQQMTDGGRRESRPDAAATAEP